MVNLQSILAEHRSRTKPLKEQILKTGDGGSDVIQNYSSSEIPDLFFDKIIVDFKLSRIEILVLMYIYRRVWCIPNIYKNHGISQMMSHTEMSNQLGITIDDVYSALRKLEEFDMIKTLRAGQYFSRKFFSKELDEIFMQKYDDFEV